MVQFASYLRRVLCKTRLIFPRINGPNVELLSGTISTTVVVSDWCITNLACIRILSTPGLWFFTDVYLSFSKNSPSPEGDDG